MDALVILVLFVVGCAGMAPILAIVALVRQRTMGRRLSELRSELELLTSRVNGLERPRAGGSATAVPVVAQPAAEPGSEAVAPPAVEIPPVTSRPEPPEPEPMPERVPGTAATVPTELPAPPVDEHRGPTPPSVPPGPSRGSLIEWERWVGMRGAALLGAVALGLAGLLFFKYSIDHGLITPAMRVVLGTVVGLGCLVGSEVFRGREHPHLAEGLSGAGVVILYAAFWAAHIRYGLIPLAPAFVLMVLVTAACCAIAWRHSAFAVAVIGLVGGFATPLLLSTGADRPIGLFGYVMLLDLGLLGLGHRRRWPSLVGLSLLGTVLIQALWIGSRMSPDRFVLALIILGLFAALFVIATRLGPDEMQRKWLVNGWAALFFPFAFALYFASRADLGPNLYPLAILLALLCAAASWLSREQGRYEPALGCAAASLAVIGVWLVRTPLEIARMWEVVAVLVGLGGLFHLFVERDREGSGWESPTPAALVSAGGAFLLMLASMGNVASEFSPWPWIAGFLALAALVYRHAGLTGRGYLQLIAAACAGFGLIWMYLAHQHRPSFPPPLAYLALMVAVAAGTHGVALSRRRVDTRRWADYAAAAIAVIMLIGMGLDTRLPAGPNTTSGLGLMLILGLLSTLAATRLASGWAYAVSVFATWFPQGLWTLAHRGSSAEAATALGLATGSVAVLTAWPFLARARFATERVAWYAAALAGPLWFFTLRRLFERAFGDQAIGVLPVTLSLISFAALMRARKLWKPGDALRLTAVAWFAAMALGFVSIAVPLQLDREWITIGWALEGVAVLALWRRLDHPGLKYFGLLLLGGASIRLVFNPALLDYYPRSAVRIFNWLMYTYLVPAASLLGGAAILRPLEVERLRGRERELYPKPLPYGAAATAISTVMVVFVWLNLAIADWFSTGNTLTLSFGQTPAQRLTVSLAWAVYGLLLLGLGMARGSQGLRWVSLAFLMGTIGKVFLYDLGHLRDLYRVFSLVGLAASLLLVSYLYQRFVFRRGTTEASP